MSPTGGIKNFSKLPKNAKKYIYEIEKQSGIKVSYVSTGPSREEIITV